MSILKISLSTAVALTAMAASTIPTKAAPLPTNVGTFKSMNANNVTEVRWAGGRGVGVGWRGAGVGWRGAGVGWRGAGVGWRGAGVGWRGAGWGYQPWGALATGAVVGGALASGAYYGDNYYDEYPYYNSYAGYGYDGDGCTCPY